MRDYTNEEYWAIKGNPLERKILRFSYTSAMVDYIFKYCQEPKQICKLINQKYQRMWNVLEASNQLPNWNEILNLIDKTYGNNKM